MTRRFVVTTLLLSPVLGAQDAWQIDSAHSAAQFAIRHMMVSTVRGGFGTMKGTVVWNAADPSKSSVEATVDVKTINTRNEKRDNHLRSADFFEIDKFPTMTFKSIRVEGKPGAMKLVGNLTIRDVTRQVVFDVEGPTPPLRAGAAMKMGATATTKINRSDFGLTWNRAIEAGGVTVGDQVTITVDLELTRPAVGAS
jgi:polyisoprenoid-binding protein YceI